jgi:hypothetical protein
VLTRDEVRILQTFRQYLIVPGEMLCFSGTNLKQNKVTLEQMTDKQLLHRERFQGGYSLTQVGFKAMNHCK